MHRRTENRTRGMSDTIGVRFERDKRTSCKSWSPGASRPETTSSGRCSRREFSRWRYEAIGRSHSTPEGRSVPQRGSIGAVGQTGWFVTRVGGDQTPQSGGSLTAQTERRGAESEVDLARMAAQVSPPDLLQIQNQAAVQLNEIRRRQPLPPTRHCLPDDHPFAIGQVNGAVVAVRLDEGDIPRGYPASAMASLNKQSLLGRC